MPTRQPAGRAGAQWTNFASLERALRAFVAAHGRPDVLPPSRTRGQAELLAAGPCVREGPDLAGAIALHGGHRPRERGGTACLGLGIPAYAGTRKPYRYWQDPASLDRELRAFVATHG